MSGEDNVGKVGEMSHKIVHIKEIYFTEITGYIIQRNTDVLWISNSKSQFYLLKFIKSEECNISVQSDPLRRSM